MFKVSDYVVYGLTGVCRITDIRKYQYAGNDENLYYVLSPVYDKSNTTIMVPVDTHRVMMRPISSEDDVLSLIAAMPATETVWIDDEELRYSDLKAALKSGKMQEWVRVIRTVYLEREARAANGKKITKTDEEIMNSAERQLNQEFAMALNISPDKVASYIRERLL